MGYQRSPFSFDSMVSISLVNGMICRLVFDFDAIENMANNYLESRYLVRNDTAYVETAQEIAMRLIWWEIAD